MGQVIYETVANYGAAAVVAVLAILSGLSARYLLVLIDSVAVRGIVQRAILEIHDAVLEVGQTYAGALKAANHDGKLTNEEKTEAKRRAIAIAKSNIGKKGLRRLARILKVESVERWLSGKVEATVATLPKGGKLLESVELPQ